MFQIETLIMSEQKKKFVNNLYYIILLLFLLIFKFFMISLFFLYLANIIKIIFYIQIEPGSKYWHFKNVDNCLISIIVFLQLKCKLPSKCIFIFHKRHDV